MLHHTINETIYITKNVLWCYNTQSMPIIGLSLTRSSHKNRLT